MGLDAEAKGTARTQDQGTVPRGLSTSPLYKIQPLEDLRVRLGQSPGHGTLAGGVTLTALTGAGLCTCGDSRWL